MFNYVCRWQTDRTWLVTRVTWSVFLKVDLYYFRYDIFSNMYKRLFLVGNSTVFTQLSCFSETFRNKTNFLRACVEKKLPHVQWRLRDSGTFCPFWRIGTVFIVTFNVHILIETSYPLDIGIHIIVKHYDVFKNLFEIKDFAYCLHSQSHVEERT